MHEKQQSSSKCEMYHFDVRFGVSVATGTMDSLPWMSTWISRFDIAYLNLNAHKAAIL